MTHGEPLPKKPEDVDAHHDDYADIRDKVPNMHQSAEAYSYVIFACYVMSRELRYAPLIFDSVLGSLCGSATIKTRELHLMKRALLRRDEEEVCGFHHLNIQYAF